MSFGEILVIAVVALVVLGPERLPAVARTLGALVARAQRFAMSVKADIQRETDLAGLATLKQDVQETAYALKAQLSAELEEASRSVREVEAELAVLASDAPAETPSASPTDSEPTQPPVAPAVDAEKPVAAAVDAAVEAPTEVAAEAPVQSAPPVKARQPRARKSKAATTAEAAAQPVDAGEQPAPPAIIARKPARTIEEPAAPPPMITRQPEPQTPADTPVVPEAPVAGEAPDDNQLDLFGDPISVPPTRDRL